MNSKRFFPLLFLLVGIYGSLSVSVHAQTAALDKVTLSSDKIVSWCPVSRSPQGMCSIQQTRVAVNTVVKNPNSEPIAYNYVVSGGEIEGHGSRVVWNLSKAPPGKHSITVGLGHGEIIGGNTITKPLLLEECPICDLGCECPSVSIVGPDTPITAGDAFIVTARIDGGEDVDYRKMKWTVSEGTIVEGQGTPGVLVRTLSAMRSKVLAVTFAIPTGCSETCANNITENFSINTKKP